MNRCRSPDPRPVVQWDLVSSHVVSRQPGLGAGGGAELTPEAATQVTIEKAAGLGQTSSEENRMTKADLVEQVADAIGPRVTKRDCGLVVDAFLDTVKDALARGDHIELRGFGTFKVRHRKARTARNPRTGEPVQVPPRAVPVFQPSKHFRGRVDRD